MAEGTARHTAANLAACHPIWCDPAMVNLIAAAADTHPVEPFYEHQLSAPHGIIIFAKPIPTVWERPGAGGQTVAPLSAITWASALSHAGDPLLSIVSWQRQTGRVRHIDEDVKVYYPGLRPASYVVGRYGAPRQRTGPAGPNEFLQTLAALCRSPLTGESTSTGSTDARRRARRAGLTDPAIRRVYLRRPEHGQAELHAARAARKGQPARGHWVRGHWKRQWFASIDEHRTIWIEGYPRGDFTLGQVSGTKVLIATGDRPPRTAAPAEQTPGLTHRDGPPHQPLRVLHEQGLGQERDRVGRGHNTGGAEVIDET